MLMITGLWKTKNYFQVDGVLFFKKDTPYVSGPTDEVLWIKPYILPDVFDGVSVPKSMMDQKPNNYTDFAGFVDDVNNGRIKSKKNKKKKVNKEFVPEVHLQLPPPMEKQVKEKKKGKGGNQQGKGRGRGGDTRKGQYGGNVGQAQGDRMRDNYSRMHARANHGPYGEGAVTGYDYYGDERDFYYPGDTYGYEGRTRPGKQKDPFRMSEMQAALSFYENRNRRNPSRGGSQSRHYQLF